MSPAACRILFWINAIVAWAAVGLSVTLSITGYSIDALDRTVLPILTAIVVAVVLTMLIARPAIFTRTDAPGAVWRALRLDSVLMATITGLVHNLLLAETGASGWDLLSATLLHWVVPLLTPIVWIVAGPRGLITLRTIGLAMVLPLLWAGFALAHHGLVVVVILIVTVVLALILMAVDAGLRWTMRVGARID